MKLSTTPFNLKSATADVRAPAAQHPAGRPPSGREVVRKPSRRPLVDEVRNILVKGDGRGVILAGGYGVGKTFAARQVVEDLAQDSLVISLRCSSSTEAIEYGAISPLLDNVAVEALSSPMAVLFSITKMLNARAAGRDVFIFVDNVQHLDKRSALVLTQLTVNGVCRLLAACESLTAVPREILGLWRDGLIRRIDVGAFSLPEAHQWFQSLLNAKVSEAASQALWAAGGGIPRFLDVIVSEQIEAGILVKVDDSWVITGEAFVCGGNGTDTVLTALGSLSEPEHAIAEILALSGGMALERLLAVVDVAALDALEKRGYLKISRGESAQATLSNWLMAKVLRNQVPAGRSRVLRRMVLASSDAPAEAVQPSFSEAIWSLDCGVPCNLQQTLVAAREATASGSPRDALRLLEAVPGGREVPEVLPELVRVRLALGELTKARNLIAGSEAQISRLPDRPWVDVMLLRAALARSEDQGPDQPRDILAKVDARLADLQERPQNLADGGILDLQEDLALGRLEQALHEGQYAASVATLRGIHESGRSRQSRMLAGTWLVQALTLTGCATDAVRISGGIDPETPGGPESPPVSGATDSVLVTAVVEALSSARVGRHQLWAPTGMFMDTRLAGYGELADGLLAAYKGLADKALESLLPAASQLRVLGEKGTWALAIAAIAYAYALKGDNDMALEYLNRGRDRTEPSARLATTACGYFQVLASAELASKDKAIVRLYALADEESTYQTAAVEMMFVNAAVRLGHVSGAPRLVALAGGLQGPLAGLCTDFGRGLVARDVNLLIKVAQAAAEQGDSLFSRDIARTALRIAGENTDRVGIRLAQQLIRGGMVTLGQVKVTDEDGQRLTGREQEVAAQAAAGASNKDIAAKMHISVRTVEGHLYQIYSKLQVTSRAELRETLA